MTTKKHEVPEELLSGLLANYKKPEDLIGENGLLKQLTKLLVEKALDAELTEHLGHDRHESVANATGNTRNGKSKKTLKGEFGELPIEVPRDRHDSFEPQLIPKHQTRWNGFDDKIISLYARGMTVREIQAHLQEMYGTEVSPSLISSVTDAVSEEVKAWQARPLDPIYPIVYLDCIHVKVREGAESFFQLLKRERIRRQIYPTRQDARADVFNYIEMFYNPKRRHNTSGGVSPVEFEKRQSQRLGSV